MRYLIDMPDDWKNYDGRIDDVLEAAIIKAKKAVEFKEMLPGYRTERKFNADKKYYEDMLLYNNKPVKLWATEEE